LRNVIVASAGDETVGGQDEFVASWLKPLRAGVSHTYDGSVVGEDTMRLAGWAIFGSLLINLAFGVIVAGAYTTARPFVVAALACTHRHASGSAPRPAVGQYLAAVRMGWTVG